MIEWIKKIITTRIRNFRENIISKAPNFAIWIACLGAILTSQNPAFALEPPIVSGANPDAVFEGHRKERALIDGGPSTFGAKTSDPKNTYEKCGQNCIRSRANENLSLQISYILKRRAFLESKDTDNDEKVEILGEFCKGNEKKKIAQNASSADKAPLQDCIKEYLTLIDFWLIKARRAIQGNEKSIEELKSTALGVVDLKRTGEDDYWATYEAKPSGKAMAPYLANFDELAHWAGEERRARTGLNVKGDQEIFKELTEGSQKSMGLKPVPEDFIVFKCIGARDPVDGSCRNYEAEMENGSLKRDPVAFQEALNLWNDYQPKLKKRLTDNRGPPLWEHSEVEHRKMVNESNQGLLQPQNRKVNRKIYDAARGEFVGDINHFIKTNPYNITTTSFSFPGNKPGAPAPVSNAELNKYTGYESVEDPGLAPQQPGSSQIVDYTVKFEAGQLQDIFVNSELQSVPGKKRSSTNPGRTGNSTGQTQFNIPTPNVQTNVPLSDAVNFPGIVPE